MYNYRHNIPPNSILLKIKYKHDLLWHINMKCLLISLHQEHPSSIQYSYEPPTRVSTTHAKYDNPSHTRSDIPARVSSFEFPPRSHTL